MTLQTASVTGKLFSPSGAPFVNKEFSIKYRGAMAGVPGGAVVPDVMTFQTDASGNIGALSGGEFTAGIPLSLGVYLLTIQMAQGRTEHSLTIDATMIAAGEVALEDAMLPAAAPIPAARGLPSGGAQGQVLGKASLSDYDVAWLTVSGAGGAGEGTVSEIATGTGLTGGPIVSTGTISLTEAAIASLLLAETAVQPAALASFEGSAQLDSRDAANRVRSNHTGTQAASTISDFATAADARIAASDKVSGTGITRIVAISQAAYDALDPPDANTVYLVTS